MNRRTWTGVACTLFAAALIAACGSDKPNGPADVTAADAYNAAIRWYINSVPAPSDTSDVKPTIVFVAPASGKAIDVQTQADVAAEMADMDDVVVVRFADVRDDALELDVEHEPVKDDGVLLLVGDVTPGSPPVDLNVGVYRNANDQQLYSMTVTRSGDSFLVSNATEIEPS